MYSISAGTLTHLQGCNPVGVSIAVAGLDGNITLTGADIVSGSFRLENNCASTSAIKIGVTANAQLEFLIDNYDRGFDAFRFEGAVLTVNVLSAGHDTVPMGLFIVDQQPKVGATLKIVALDYMAKFNKPYVTDLAFPATLLQMLGDACTKCGVTNSSGTLVNQAYSVPVEPTGVTFREVIAAITELTGTFGIINRLGQLVLKWYTDTGATIVVSDRFAGYVLAENDVAITGVKYKSGTVEYLAGTAVYAFLIENNILLGDGYAAVIDAISTARTGFTYRPFSCPVKGYPQLDVGDIIDPLTDTVGGNHVGIITNLEYKLNGAMDISAVGESAVSTGFASASPFTARQKNILQTVAALETSVQLSPVVESILRMNERAANSFGLFQTIVTQEDGSVIIYWHDTATLAASTYISMSSDAGQFWTVSGWNGGSPVWESGFTAEGDAVFRYLAAKGINADWINAGTVAAARVTIGSGTTFGTGYDPSTKKRVFTATPTTPYVVGDLWLTSLTAGLGDVKKCIVARATGAYVAADWVIAAKYTDDTVAISKSATFAQAAIPTSISAGDIWFDTDDGNKSYKSTAIGDTTIAAGHWVLYQDLNKTTTFAQTGIPISTAVGDIWVDTDDSNKMYRAASIGADAIVAGEWILVRDSGIAVAIQAAADAQADADTGIANALIANNKLADIASDVKITPVEKLTAKQLWDAIVVEGTATTGTIPVQAIAFGVADSTFDAKYAALSSYLNTTLAVFADMTATTTIVRATWDTAWKDYYSARTYLLNAISTKAKTLADTAQTRADLGVTNAATAQARADTAVANAATAQTAANTANGLLADIASDAKLTPVEKSSVRLEWDTIAAEKAGIDTQATTFSITTEKTTYDNAFQALATYLNAGTAWTTGIPSWITDANLSVVTTIVGATFRTNWKAYYDARTDLLIAISNKAKTLADAAQAEAAATHSTYYTQPVPPYYVGDIWVKAAVPLAVTDIVKCTTQRLTGSYTAGDWTNAYTLAEIAALGTTIISGGYIKTSMLDVVNLIAGTLTNDATDPECWATIGEITISSFIYTGIFVYKRSISATVPCAKFALSSDGDLCIIDKNNVQRLFIDTDAGDGGLAYADKDGNIRFLISPLFGTYFRDRFGNGDMVSLGSVALPDGDVQTQINTKQATLTGLTATVTELNYTDGVTSAIQTQINAKAAIAQPAWADVTFAGSWVNYGSPFNSAQYYKDTLGIVHLKGFVKSGTINTTICVLPIGYRPAGEFICAIPSNNALAVLHIETNGNVFPATGNNTWVSLDNVSFRAV